MLNVRYVIVSNSSLTVSFLQFISDTVRIRIRMRIRNDGFSSGSDPKSDYIPLYCVIILFELFRWL